MIENSYIFNFIPNDMRIMKNKGKKQQSRTNGLNMHFIKSTAKIFDFEIMCTHIGQGKQFRFIFKAL